MNLSEPLYPPCECHLPIRGKYFRNFGVPPEGVEIIDGFPDRACFAREFLANASPEYVQVGDGIITITVANGRASYGIVGENLMLNTVCGVKSPDLGRANCPYV